MRSDNAICVLQFSGWAVFLKDNWDTATFVTNYLPLILFPILYIGAKLWKRTPILTASEMDFQSGLAEIEAETYDEPPPRNKWEAFWQWLVRVFGFYFWAALSERVVLDVIIPVLTDTAFAYSMYTFLIVKYNINCCISDVAGHSN